MYNGYRLKINGRIFPNRFIAQGTYSGQDEPRVVEIWKDASHVEHMVTAGPKKANISFSIIEHDSADHAALMDYFQQDDGIEVEFYNDRTDSYRTAICRLKNAPKFSHRNTYGGKLQYKPTQISLIEN